MIKRLGFIKQNALADWQGASPFLPAFHFHEKHRMVLNTDRPQHIIPAIAEFDVKQDRVVRALLALRQLPQKLLAEPVDDFGLHSFTLLAQSESEITLGLVGRFWRYDMGLVPVADAQAFLAFNDPAYAKLVLRYQVHNIADTRYELRTETFIFTPTTGIRRKMAAYWLAIRLASGWIRTRTLQAVAQKLTLRQC